MSLPGPAQLQSLFQALAWALLLRVRVGSSCAGRSSGRLWQFPFRFDLLLDIKALLWLSEMNTAANTIPQDEISLQRVIPASFEGCWIFFFSFPAESFIPGVRKVQNDFPHWLSELH